MRSEEHSLVGFALIAFALFCALGLSVSHRVAQRVDLAGASLRGGWIRLAAIFTVTGRAVPLTVLSAVVLLIFFVARLPLWIAVTVIASQTLSQGLVDLCKRAFRRIRPDDWLLRHEAGFSYPSGHAATAVTFFGAWAVVVVRSPLPEAIRAPLAAALVLWMLGVAWSRLALAAHYVTDVAGGLLFGCGWIALVFAAILHARLLFAL